jgi:[ribosomal protein S5]-alanine N-acetyltransferase
MNHRDILLTSRLALRATTDADITPLHKQVFSDREVIRFVFSGKQFSPDESANFVKTRFNYDGADTGLATLVERASDAVIGFAGLISCEILEMDDLELGFVLAKRAWGKGYATEIGRAQMELGLGKLRRLRVLALVDIANEASIHVIEKLGMRHSRDVTVEGRGLRKVYCVEA